MLPDCKKPMVVFNCTTARPGTAGVECPDSCQIQDKDCVSAQSFMDMNTKKKRKKEKVSTLFYSLNALLLGPVAPSAVQVWLHVS